MKRKKLIIINGTMGVGKSTVCRELYSSMDRSVWLDGDWCWMMNPFIVTEENKNMVEENIIFILRNFLKNSSYDYVIFDWVIHMEGIFNIILEGLKDMEFDLYKISLICSPEALMERGLKDGRTEEQIEYSIGRLKLYENMDTIKIDTSNISIHEVVDSIKNIIV